MPEQTQDHDELDAAIDAALAQSDGPSAKDLAAAEEQQAAAMLAASRAAQEQAEAAGPTREEEPEVPLVSLAAQGREALLEALRKHQERQAAKPAYKPPPMTDAQRARLEEEMAAGRRVQARHEAQLAARPPRIADPRDGTSVPVHRPGEVVPDPKASGNSQFNGVPPTYSPEA